MPTYTTAPKHPVIVRLRWSASGVRWEIGAVVGGSRGDEPLLVASSPVGYRDPFRAYCEGCAARERYIHKEAA